MRRKPADTAGFLFCYAIMKGRKLLGCIECNRYDQSPLEDFGFVADSIYRE